jgi:hypothetical protein
MLLQQDSVLRRVAVRSAQRQPAIPGCWLSRLALQTLGKQAAEGPTMGLVALRDQWRIAREVGWSDEAFSAAANACDPLLRGLLAADTIAHED